MSSKLDEQNNNKINSSLSEPEKLYNPLEYNANIQQELWIQKEVSLIIKVFFINYLLFQYNCFIPGLLFEVKAESFPGWDLTDLENFFSEIGEIQFLKNQGTKTIVIYYRFYDALVALEFFKNSQNFKEEINKDTFSTTWLELNEEVNKSFSKEVQDDIFNIFQRFREFYKSYFVKGGIGPNSFNPFNHLMGDNMNNYINTGYLQMNQQQNQSNNNDNSNMQRGGYGNWNNLTDNGSIYNNPFNNSYYEYYENMNKENNKFNNNKFNNSQNNNNNSYNNNHSGNQSNNNYHNQNTNYQQNSNSNNNNQSEEDLKSGKYTCRFEILIDNDKEFQIARKLIGSKGCNMKKIVETCAGNEPSEVKLRLRGRGSGFREGPQQIESDEPLHLCVSSKYLEKYQQACTLVQDLINSVYDEYKKFCYKSKITPLSSIYKVIEEGISTRKVHYGRDSNNFHKHY